MGTIHDRLTRLIPLSLLAAAILVAGSFAVSPASADERRVYINRVRLGPQQIQTLERRYRVRVLSGRYWYDAISGAWGFEGGPAAGQIHPNLKLGGRLRADASGGGNGRLTGVFFNGRELHPLDVQALYQITRTVIPGRYWVNAYGIGGFEGGSPIFNLRAAYAAVANSRPRTWREKYGTSLLSDTHVGNGYVMGRTSGGGSWGVTRY